jgi:hypothetical protein
MLSDFIDGNLDAKKATEEVYSYSNLAAIANQALLAAIYAEGHGALALDMGFAILFSS